MVLDLLLDDSSYNYGIRTSLFSNAWTEIGIACTSNTIYKYVCVFELGIDVKPKYWPVVIPGEEPEKGPDVNDHSYM